MSCNIVLEVPTGTIDGVRKYYNVTEECVGKDLEILKEWFKKQPHLPQDIEDGMLERILARNKYRIEQTKAKIEGYFTLRGTHQEYYVFHRNVMPSKEPVATIYLPKLTPNFERVVLSTIINPDPELYDPVRAFGLTLLCCELGLRHDYRSGLIFLLDFKLFSLGFLKKVSPALLWKFQNLLEVGTSSRQIMTALSGCHLLCKFTETCAMFSISTFNRLKMKTYSLKSASQFTNCLAFVGAYSDRVRTINIINAPSTIQYVLSLIQTILRPKYLKKITIHPDLDSLHRSVPRECLPEEYGGALGKLSQILENWDRALEANARFFDENLKRVANEELRVGPVAENNLFGAEGTFKKLNLD